MSEKISEYIILMVICPVEFGGGEVQLLLKARKLKEKGFKVKIILLAKSGKLEYLLAEYKIDYLIINNKELGYNPSFSKYVIHFIKSVPKILKINFNLNTKYIFLVNGFPAIFFPLLIKFRLKNKYKFVYFHHHYPFSKIFIWFRHFYKFILNNYDLIVGVSSNIKYALLRYFPSLKEKIILLPNAIADDYFIDKIDKNIIRKELGLPENEILGIYVARFAPLKNHFFLVDLLKEIKRYKLNIKLVLIGSGSMKKYFLERANKENVSDMIIKIDYLPHNEVIKYYYASDICFFPSLVEGFGNAILEAKMAGLPVIIFEKIYTKEHGRYILVANNKEEFFYYSMKLIINNKYRKYLSELARIEAEEYKISSLIDKYEMELKVLIEK